MKRTAKELAESLGATLEGDGSVELAGIASPEKAGARDLIYVEKPKHAARAAASAALCAIAGEGVALPGKTVLRTAQPKVAFAKRRSCRWAACRSPPESMRRPSSHPSRGFHRVSASVRTR